MSTTTRAERGPVLAALPVLRQRLSMIVGGVLVTVLSIWLVVNAIKAPGSFGIVPLSGIRDGSIYALVALGYTLVYGIIELINFAHGDVFMWGNMITITIATTIFGLDGSQSWAVTIPLVILTLLGAMAFCATLNVTIERLAYRPLRSAPRLAPLITAIACPTSSRTPPARSTASAPRASRTSSRPSRCSTSAAPRSGPSR